MPLNMSPEAQIPEAITGGTAGEPVLEVPMVLDHAIDVTPTPHASDAFIGDSSRSLSRAPLSGFRGRAIALGLGVLGTIGVGGFGSASAQDATEPPRTEDPNATVKPVETGTPEPGGSVAPSEDPITGVLPSCPPEASPSPVVSPSPTPAILAFVNNEGQNVNVTLADQELPSAPPSEDPETALLDDPNCEPDPNGSPTPSAAPSTGPSAAPSEAPTPSPTPDRRTFSPEEIEGLLTGEFSIDAFIALEDKPLDNAGFKKIIRRGASAMADFLQRHGEPDATREQVIQKETDYLADLTKTEWSMNYTGRGIISKVSFSIEKAQQAVREGNIPAARAFRNRGHAYLRIGLTISKDPSLERIAREDAKSLNLR